MKKNKITLLLGAGFAKYMHGIGTSEINELFAKDTKYLESYNGEQMSLYKYVESVLSDSFYDLSFETFLAFLEQVLDYRLGEDYNERTSTRDRSLSSVMLRPNVCFASCNLISQGIQSLWRTYVHYINTLIKAIANYDCLNDYGDESVVFQEFISMLMDSFDKVKIYSTNYDTLCPQLFVDKNIFTSTVNIPNNGLEEYYVYDLKEFNDRPLTYFPLHGSIKIKRDHFNTIKYCLYEQYLPDYAIDNSAGNPNGPTLFTPIISGYNKLQHISGKPFVFGLQAFGNDLQDSDTVITLGYSYSDAHINSYISTFSNVKVISVTMDPVMGLPIDLQIDERVMDLASFFDYYLHSTKRM